jgi:Glycosyl transferase family 2
VTTQEDRPPVSVVMPVHNALPHLDDAVRSILDQTFRDFELVIYDDGSTDGSTERLRNWAPQDSRIRLVEGKRNLGPVESSAFVVEQSSAAVVARMDADDISHPDRLRRQFELLRDHPSVGLVGTLYEVIDGGGRRVRRADYWRLTRKTPFAPFAVHGSIMFRRTVFNQVGGYRRECEFWEDQDLVTRMGWAADVLVVPEPLYRVRMWTRNTRTSSDPERTENAVDLMYRCVARLEQGRSYDELLQSPSTPDRVDPRVFIAATSLRLWAGGRPRQFGRLLRRGRLEPDLRTLSALVLTAWAGMSPSTVRAFMQLLLKGRNMLARRIARSPAPVHWSPPRVGTAGHGRRDCALAGTRYSSSPE